MTSTPRMLPRRWPGTWTAPLVACALLLTGGCIAEERTADAPGAGQREDVRVPVGGDAIGDADADPARDETSDEPREDPPDATHTEADTALDSSDDTQPEVIAEDARDDRDAPEGGAHDDAADDDPIDWDAFADAGPSDTEDARDEDARDEDARDEDAAEEQDAVDDAAEDDPPVCVPSCAGRRCGPDGCQGVCGTCGDLEGCEAGQCVALPRPWEALLDERIGFGRAARGGAGGSVCWVDNTNDAGPGSFRACAESDEPRWIRFRTGGTIRLQRPVMVGSFTTVDGRGHRVRFEHQGLTINNRQHVILYNIEIGSGGGSDSSDAIQIINGAQHIWVHHVTLESFPDGLLDITRGATDVTVSWSHFRNHDKVMLIGADKADTGDTVIRVTLHHNWFQRTNQRHPRLRYGRVHVFNNYFERWGSYAIGSSQRGEVRSERNVYEAGDRREAFQTEFAADDARGYIRSVTDLRLRNATTTQHRRDDVFYPDYPFTVVPADDTLIQRIRANAGRRERPAP